MTLQAGRELDALIAEKVMGWQAHHRQDKCDGVYIIRCGSCGGDGHANCYGGGQGSIQSLCEDVPCGDEASLPPYTEEIAAAWQVAEKLRKRAFLFALWNKGHGFVACFSSDDPVYWLEGIESGPASVDTVQADTAPLAICLAALKAVGVEVPDA